MPPYYLLQSVEKLDATIPVLYETFPERFARSNPLKRFVLAAVDIDVRLLYERQMVDMVNEIVRWILHVHFLEVYE